MARLNIERQKVLEPKRMDKAIQEFEKLGYKWFKVSETELHIVIDTISNSIVKYFPYSGWATGKDIKDGRGLKKLLRQLTANKL